MSKVRGMFTGAPPETDFDGETSAGTPAQPQTKEPQTVAASPPQWVGMLVDQIPWIMLLIGLTLTAMAQLVSVWAFLGFLLVACSPMVYWLRRIELRLGELVELAKQREKRH